jgi:hypothetical protein
MFKKIWFKILYWLMRTRFYNWLLTSVIPYIRFTTYYTHPTNKNFPKWGALMLRGYVKLKPGHIILTVDEKKLTTKLISGFTGEQGFSHAAFCVSKDKKFEVAEMTHTNFTKSTWADICFESTRVIILQCDRFDISYIKQMLNLTEKFEDTPYDNQFVLGFEALSCAELVYVYDFEKRLDIRMDPVIGGKPYISPMGLYNAKNCRIIWDSDEETI